MQRYELMERGGYIPTGYKFDPIVLNTKLPLEFFEARNALRILNSGLTICCLLSDRRQTSSI